MRRVMQSKQVAHVWASQNQSEARNPNRSLYFSGDTIWSYGSHYVAGRIYKHNEKPYDFALINSHRYSVTTAKQLSYIRSALRGRMDFLEVPEPQELMHPSNEGYLLDRIADELDKVFGRARDANTSDLYTAIGDLNRLYSFQNRSKRFELDLWTTNVVSHILRAKVDAGLEREAHKEARAERNRLRLLEKYSKELALWEKGLNTVTILAHVFPYDMVRLKSPDTVETSRGAEVPLSHAKIAIELYKRKERLKGLNVGHFTIETEPNAIGAVKIGCHTVNIEQAMRALNL